MTITHPAGPTFRVEVFWDNAIWYNITNDIRACSLQTDQRGRLANAFDPGRLVLQVSNGDRKYDPLHSAGPYFGDLKPGRLVRAYINGAEVWWGLIDSFSIDYDRSNKDSVVTLTAITPLAYAAMQSVPAGRTPALTEGENVYGRATAVTSVSAGGVQAGRPSWLDEANYVARCSGQDRWDTTRDRNILDELKKLADIEQAPLFSSATSNFVDIYARHWFKLYSQSATSQATFGTGGLPFWSVDVRFDADEIITAVSMTDELGNAVVAIDTAGEAEYGTRYPSVSYNELPSLNDEDLEGAANTVINLRATESFRVESLTVRPGASSTLAGLLDNLVLLSRITVSWTPTGTGSAITADYFIDGITHDITPGDWTTTYSLWPCAPFDDALPGTLFIVGSSLVGGSHVIGL